MTDATAATCPQCNGRGKATAFWGVSDGWSWDAECKPCRGTGKVLPPIPCTKCGRAITYHRGPVPGWYCDVCGPRGYDS